MFFEKSDAIDKILAKEISTIFSWYTKMNPEDSLDELIVCGDTDSVSGLKGKLEKLLEGGAASLKIRLGDILGRITNSGGTKFGKENKDTFLYVAAIGSALEDLDPCDRKYELLPSASCGPTVVKSKYVTTNGNKNKSFISLEDIKYNFEIMPQRRQILWASIFISIAIIILAGALIWYLNRGGKF